MWMPAQTPACKGVMQGVRFPGSPRKARPGYEHAQSYRCMANRMHQTTPCLVGDDAGNAGVLGAHAGASIILLPVDTSLLRPAGCRWWAGLAVGVAAEGSEGQGVSCQEPWLTTTTAAGSARPRVANHAFQLGALRDNSAAVFTHPRLPQPGP